MSKVRAAARAYLYELNAAYARGLLAEDAPLISELAEAVGVHQNHLAFALSDSKPLLHLELLWKVQQALRVRGFAPTVEDMIYWPPLRSARSIPALDAWRPDPVEERAGDESRLHITLDAYLKQMKQVSRQMDEPLPVPRTRTLAAAGGVTPRTMQRLRADQTQQVSRELLGGVVGHLHGLGIDVRPAQLIAEPVQ